MDADVAVVGAGPAGLIAAREAAKRGVNVAVFEEHEEVGVPCHCAGLLSIRGLMELEVPLSAGFVQNRLKGAHFFSPSGLSFTVGRREAVACVADRSALDKFLARQATHAGANIRLQSKVQRIKRQDEHVTISGPWGSMSAGMAVDAEGLRSRFVRQMGLTPLKPECVLPALQFELVDVDVDSAYAEIYVGKKVAPDFFAWVIPLNDYSVRVGLACKEVNPLKTLKSFVRSRFGNSSRVSVRPGRIVICGPIPRTFDDNFVVVGDAAGQVKPTTGGGVILGGICASIAGEVAAEAVKRGVLNSSFLREYQRLWKGRLGKEFRITRLARRIINRLSDKTLDKIFKIVVKENLQTEFSVKGDMDFQASLLSSFIKKGDVLKILLTAAPDIIRF